MEAAPSKSCSLIAFSFWPLISSISASSVFDFRRARHGADARARTRFVHQVDGLVRQKTIRDVTIGKLHRGFDGRVGDLGLVMFFVFVREAL